jgi:hypothetical protein
MAYTLTAQQIRAIWEAGREPGSEEATAYEWGSRPSLDKFRELEDTLVWSDECGLTTGLDYEDKSDWRIKFLSEIQAG